MRAIAGERTASAGHLKGSDGRDRPSGPFLAVASLMKRPQPWICKQPDVGSPLTTPAQHNGLSGLPPPGPLPSRQKLRLG
jgi:hypothetical protein